MNRKQLLIALLSLSLLTLGLYTSVVGHAGGSTDEAATPEVTPEATQEAAAKMGDTVRGEKWAVTVSDLEKGTTLQDVFGDTYGPTDGSVLVLVNIHVENLGDGAKANLPASNTMISGVLFYETKPPPSAFSLDKLNLRTSDDKTAGLMGFGVGQNASEFLVAPNLTDFSVAFPGAEGDFTLAYQVPGALVDDALTLEFEDLQPVSLSFTPSAREATPEATASTDSETATIQGTVYQSQDHPLKDIEIDLDESGTTLVAKTTTDANGHYSFTGVKPGNYTVSAIWILPNQFDVQSCGLTGLDFRGDWFVAVATQNGTGKTIILSVLDLKDQTKAGAALQEDLDLGCG